MRTGGDGADVVDAVLTVAIDEHRLLYVGTIRREPRERGLDGATLAAIPFVAQKRDGLRKSGECVERGNTAVIHDDNHGEGRAKRRAKGLQPRFGIEDGNDRRRGWERRVQKSPPLTEMTCRVTYAASGEKRNATTPATSSGVPNRRMGIAAFTSS